MIKRRDVLARLQREQSIHPQLKFVLAAFAEDNTEFTKSLTETAKIINGLIDQVEKLDFLVGVMMEMHGKEKVLARAAELREQIARAQSHQERKSAEAGISIASTPTDEEI